MGLIVDSVDEVVNLGAADIEPTPDFGTTVNTSYLLGMAKVKNRVMAFPRRQAVDHRRGRPGAQATGWKPAARRNSTGPTGPGGNGLRGRCSTNPNPVAKPPARRGPEATDELR